MTLSKAISKKLLSLCNERNISINYLASVSLITQSTLQSLILEKSKNPKLLTIIKICNGLEITLTDFFCDDIFKYIDI